MSYEYFTDLVNKIREDISKVKNKLYAENPKSHTASHADTSRNYSINAVYKNNKTAEEDRDCITATLNLPESINIDAKTEERTKRWRDDRAAWLQVAAIFVGAVVAAIYFFQLRVMKQPVDDSREHFIQDERAWVNVTDYHPDFQIGQPGEIAVVVTNTGKSPALGVHSKYGGEVVKKGTMPKFNYPTQDMPGNQQSNSALQNGVPMTLRTYTTVPLSLEINQKLASGEWVFYVYGEVRYTDIFRTEHTSQFRAFVRPNLINTGDCEIHNAAD